MSKSRYHIGQKGIPWSDQEKQQWRDSNTIQRSYKTDVVEQIIKLSETVDVHQYGALSYDKSRYPLYSIRNKNWCEEKPVVLITGGVHGYETSGVHGALLFVETEFEHYTKEFNIFVVPCVSPWGYETINRWNPKAIDPNRSFYMNSPAEESASVMSLIEPHSESILVHIDLHETTDTDESEFRPALAARDGIEYIAGEIPDGFYTVGDDLRSEADFQAAVISSVAEVTHIAEADSNNEIIGSPVVQHGVINYPMEALGLCGAISNAKYHTTTEVYPDSEKVTDDECNRAQVAAIKGALNYVISMKGE